MSLFRETEWTPEIEEVLEPTFDGERDAIFREIQNGISQLWEYQEGENQGYIITRLEGNELVLVCGAGKKGYLNAINHIQNFARENNLSLRIHTKKKGITRLLERAGFELNEYIYKWQSGT